MKLNLCFKTPDALEDAAKDAVVTSGLDPEDYAEGQELFEKLMEAGQKFVQYKEYIYIEIDTDAGTAKVLEKS